MRDWTPVSDYRQITDHCHLGDLFVRRVERPGETGEEQTLVSRASLAPADYAPVRDEDVVRRRSTRA